MGNCADSTESKDPTKITPITSLNQQPSLNSPQLTRRKLILPPIVRAQGKIYNQSEKQKNSDVKVKVRMLDDNKEQENGSKNANQQLQQIQLKLQSSIYRKSSRPLLKKLNTNQKVSDKNSQTKQNDIQKKQSLLHMIKTDILTNPALMCVLSKTFFEKLNSLLVSQSWSYDYLTLITKLLLDYINFSVKQLNNESKSQISYQLDSLPQLFGRQLNRLYKQVKMRNSRLILSYQYYDKFRAKQFTFSTTQGLQQILDQISSFSFDSKASLPFISTYLIKSCLKLQSNNVLMEEINKRLLYFVEQIQKKYSAIKKQAIKQQKQKLISLYQNQLSQIDQLNSQDLESPNKVYIFKSKDKNLKQQELNIVINSLREQSKRYYSVFTEFTGKGCFENQGFGFQTHLKFKNHHDKFTLLRVKEKFCHLHSKQFQKIIPKNCKTIQDLRQFDYKLVKAALIYSYSKQSQIQLFNNDLLYGKCSFNNVKDIKDTIKSFKKNLKSYSEKNQNIKIVQIQNKLIQQGKIVLRLKIGQVKCQFILYLRTFQALNEICEGISQITQSKLFSPTTLLLQWHQRLCNNYFNFFEQINKDNKRQSDIKKMKKLFKFEIQTDSRLQIQLQNKKYYDTYMKIKQKITNLKVDKKLCERIQIRSAKCFTELKFYKQALQQLENFTNKNDLQWMFLISQAYKNCSLILHATNHYQTYIIEASVRSYQNDQNIFLASKFLCFCYIENGHYQKGLELAQKLLNKYAQNNSNINLQYAQVLVIIGRALTLLGKPNEALKKYQRSINIFDELKAKKDPLYMKAYCGLAQIYAIYGKTAEVDKTFRQVITLQEQIYGQSLQAAETMIQIGTTYMIMSNLKQSQFFIKLAIQMIESLVGREGIQFYNSLIPLSNLYKNLSRFDAAEQLIKIYRGAIVKKIGRFCYQNGLLYLHLGSIARGRGRINNAVTYLRQSLMIFQQIQEQDTVNALLIYKELIYCFKSNKDRQSLLQCFHQAQKLITKIYGQNSLQIAQLQSVIGQIFIQNEMYAEGQQACQSIITKFQEKKIDFCQDYVKILKSLIQIYIKTEKYDKANFLLKKTIQIYEKNLIKNIEYANLCNLYGNICLEQNKQLQAKQCFKKSLTVYNKFNHSQASVIQSQLTQLSPKKQNSPSKGPR